MLDADDNARANTLLSMTNEGIAAKFDQFDKELLRMNAVVAGLANAVDTLTLAASVASDHASDAMNTAVNAANLASAVNSKMMEGIK